MALLCCVMIFYFTSSPDFTYKETKRDVVDVAKVWENAKITDRSKPSEVVREADKTKNTNLAKTLNYITFIVRKMAHLSLFGFLAVFIQRAIQDNKLSFIYAWMISTAYGATDEFHQMFVPNRTPLLSDVGIDSTGALLALVILFLWLHFRKKDLTLRSCMRHN